MSMKIRAIGLSLGLFLLFFVKCTQPTIAYENPLLDVNVAGYNLTAGNENEMSISIENVGETAAYDVKAALSVPSAISGISILEGSYATFKKISSYSDTIRWMYPVLYVSRDCPLGAYSLTLQLEYTDASDRTYADSVQIGIVVDTTKPGEPLLEINVTGYSLTAGGENEMSISIGNIGKTTAYDVEVALTTPSTVSGISIVKGSYARFDVIHYKETAWMYPVLYVSRDCSLGAYSLTLELEYIDASDTRYVDGVQIGVVVDAVKPTEVDLSVDVEDFHVTAGAENEINVTVTNVGEEPVHDVEAILTSNSPSSIVVLRELSYLFDEIDVGNHINFRPLLAISQDIPLGTYSLTLTLDYKDSKGVSYHDEVTVGLFVDSVEPTERTRIAVQNYQLTPTEVFPGDELTVEMELKNWGANAYDVQVQLSIDSQSPFVSLGPALVFVGNLGSNQTRKVAYNLRVSGDAEARLYVLQMAISYYDVDDQPNSLTEAISISVHSIVDFRLLDIQPSIVSAEAGETVTIEADLLLLGTETVDFVEVEIVENRSIGPFISVPQSYEYIGRVDPDSPVLFTIQFMVDPNATSGSYTVQLSVDCWDGYNQQRQVMIELPVVVEELSNQNEETSPALWEMIWTIIRILFGLKP